VGGTEETLALVAIFDAEIPGISSASIVLATLSIYKGWFTELSLPHCEFQPGNRLNNWVLVMLNCAAIIFARKCLLSEI